MRAPHGSAILSFLVGVPASAATVTVPTDFSRIQDALDAAAPGDTVFVLPGTYSGAGNRDLDFNGKSVVLIGSGGAEFTIIDCQGSEEDPHRGLQFHSGEDETTILQGFTIRNGYSISFAGGISCRGSRPRILACIIEDCHSPSWGGGLGIWDGSDVVIQNCRIQRNASEYRGGGLFSSDSAVQLVNCEVTENAAPLGGGLYGLSSQVSVDGSVMAGNTANTNGGGAINCSPGTEVHVSHSRIMGNRAVSVGGGILASGPLTMTNVVVSGNIADLGGGIRYLNNPSGSIITQCTIAGNHGRVAGGGLHGGSPDLALVRNIVRNNCAPLGSEIWTEAPMEFECCALDTFAIAGTGEVIYLDEQVVSDPLFCVPQLCLEAPTDQGSYSLSDESPCLPANSPCGFLIGALPEECVTAGIGTVLNPRSREIVAYPIPVRMGQVLHLDLAGSIVPGRALDVGLDLFDVAGRTVTCLPRPADGELVEVRIPFGLGPAGIYFLRIEHGRQTTWRKIVVVE